MGSEGHPRVLKINLEPAASARSLSGGYARPAGKEGKLQVRVRQPLSELPYSGFLQSLCFGGQ